ncbi:hypothetical protein KKF84_20475 [Myxococcota bacterium]|nr:hypothetical protein [Myxococcota bacterium]MBU1537701.1 hypothetical protein [Myxococcota bacterium]
MGKTPWGENHTPVEHCTAGDQGSQVYFIFGNDANTRDGAALREDFHILLFFCHFPHVL